MLNLHLVEFVRSAVKTADFPNDNLPQIAFAGKSNVGNRRRLTACSTERILPASAMRREKPSISTFLRLIKKHTL